MPCVPKSYQWIIYIMETPVKPGYRPRSLSIRARIFLDTSDYWNVFTASREPAQLSRRSVSRTPSASSFIMTKMTASDPVTPTLDTSPTQSSPLPIPLRWTRDSALVRRRTDAHGRRAGVEPTRSDIFATAVMTVIINDVIFIRLMT